MTTNKTNTYNKYFRQLLKEKEMSQSELARQTGMTRQSISLYALGIRPLSINAAKRIAYVLDVEFRKLIE
jgi:transcriptional regulator with XRE-family HTH domain